MRTKISPALYLSAATCMLILGGCIFGSGDNDRHRVSETVSFDGYIGAIYEYSVSDSGKEVTGDSIGLGYTSNEILIRADTAHSNSGLFAISLDRDTIVLIFMKADTTDTYRLNQAACSFAASATAMISNDTVLVPVSLKFSDIFVSSTGVSLLIDEQKSKPANLDSVDYYQKAISGSFTISCPDPR